MLASILACLGGLTLAPVPAAATTPDLSTVVLADALPGMVAAPPGPHNGPITQQTVSQFGASDAAVMDGPLANGSMSGYTRLWSQEPPNGDFAAIVAFRWNDPEQVGGFFAGLNHGIEGSGSAPVPVPGIPDASGFVGHLPIEGQPATEYSITLARGSTVFEVETVSTSGDISLDNAISMASRQAANAPGATSLPVPPSPGGDPTLRASYVLGEVAFLIVVAILILYFIQRSRRSSPKTRPDSAWPMAAPVGPGSFQVVVQSPLGYSQPQGGQGQSSGLPLFPTFAPTVPPVSAPGWYPDSNDPTLQRYFDGNGWTGHTAPR